MTTQEQDNERNIVESAEMVAWVARALSHPLRVMILRTLGEEGVYVMDLVAALGRPQANISQHLMVLRETGLVVAEREGVAIRYRVRSPRVLEALESLETVGKEVARMWAEEEMWPMRPRRRWHRRGRGPKC